MKSLFALVSLVGSLGFAKTIEPGLYQATDVDTKTIVATLDVHADQTVDFAVKSPDFELPPPGCHGAYTLNGNMLTADMECPLDFLPEVTVTLDATSITPESVRTAPGAVVNVTIDALGPDVYQFNLIKVK